MVVDLNGSSQAKLNDDQIQVDMMIILLAPAKRIVYIC